MNITVIRDTGDKPGGSISDGLLTTNAAGAERGRIEIDTNLYSKMYGTTELTNFQYLQNGSLISSLDEEVFMLTGIDVSYSADGEVIKITTEGIANDL